MGAAPLVHSGIAITSARVLSTAMTVRRRLYLVARGCLALCSSALATDVAQAAPRELSVGKFSDEFRATVRIEDEIDGVTPAAITVYQRRTGKRVLRVPAQSLPVNDEDREAAANVHDLPYGEQSVLQYRDFDFDGKPDLAIMDDGRGSCYGGPSFQVFLRRGGGFVDSPSLTGLTEGAFCGMFRVDTKQRRLFTFVKSGCCYHVFYAWKVQNGAARMVERVEEAFEGSSYLRREVTRRGREVSYFLLEEADASRDVVLSFELPGSSRRRVQVFVANEMLDYALTQGSERRVELSHWVHVLGRGRVDAPKRPFRFDAARSELRFDNGSYTYVVHDGPEGVGVRVVHRGKVVALPGISSSRRGSLARLTESKPENVQVSR
jgi:hypothetical protein